ncbi:hypothetical protein D3C80_2204240 [compost metagenome]
MAEVEADPDLLLANRKTGGQQQRDGNPGEPAEVAIGQGQAVASRKKGQVDPWQGNHVKSLVFWSADNL